MAGTARRKGDAAQPQPGSTRRTRQGPGSWSSKGRPQLTWAGESRRLRSGPVPPPGFARRRQPPQEQQRSAPARLGRDKARASATLPSLARNAASRRARGIREGSRSHRSTPQRQRGHVPEIDSAKSKPGTPSLSRASRFSCLSPHPHPPAPSPLHALFRVLTPCQPSWPTRGWGPGRYTQRAAGGDCGAGAAGGGQSRCGRAGNLGGWASDRIPRPAAPAGPTVPAIAPCAPKPPALARGLGASRERA